MNKSLFAVLAAAMMIGSYANANCSDNFHHDCGAFKILTTTCSKPSDQSTFESTEYAVFGDGKSVKLEKDAKKSAEDLDVLRGVVNEELDVYVEVSPVPDIIFGGTTLAYSGYTVSWGTKSLVRNCTLMIPEGAEMDLNSGEEAAGKR